MAHHFNAAGYLTVTGKMRWVDAQSHGFEPSWNSMIGSSTWGPKAHIYANELGGSNSGAGQPEIDYLWREEGDPWKEH